MGANRSLRVGVIGCGAISRNHIEAYQSMPGIEVVAVCDVNIEAAKACAEKHGIAQYFSDHAQLLALKLDAVSICTPHPTHEALVVSAASAGTHVICEKPIAIDLASAQRMVDACREADVELTVLFQRRFWSAAQRLKSAVDGAELGRPVLGQCSVLLHREAEYYSATDWRGTWGTDGGGVLMTQAIHYLDLLQWLMGDVVEVFGRVNTYKHGENIEVEDSAVATLVFAGGGMATVQASTAANPALGAQVRITGESGATASLIEFPEGTEGRIEIFAAGEQIDSALGHPADCFPNADLRTINEQLIPFHREQIRDFVEALQKGHKPSISGADSTRALRILLAIYESARTGEPVRFENRLPETVVEVPQNIFSSVR